MALDDYEVDCSTISEQMLEGYRIRTLEHWLQAAVRQHLEGCRLCWNRWNIYRWNHAQVTQGYQELQTYLGVSFQEYLDASWALAYDWHAHAPATQEEIEAFYQQTPFYLYSLLIWQESGHRPAYVDRASTALAAYSSKRICDFGCGIGNDGLLLLEKGYEVIFCEINVACVNFLRWRLKQRDLQAVVLTPDELV